MSKSLTLKVLRKSVLMNYLPSTDNHDASVLADGQTSSLGVYGDIDIGTRYNMGLGHIIFEDAGTHLRVFRFSSRGNLNFYHDLTPDGTWHIGPHSAYREEDIDKDKAASEVWQPWETKADYINKISNT